MGKDFVFWQYCPLNVRQTANSNMKRFFFRCALLGALWCALAARAQVDYVDNTIGGQGFMLEPTRPTVQLPNSMVRMHPIRKDQLDDQIQSFPLTLISHRLGELFWLMPSDGDGSDWNRKEAWEQETTTPYYYSTRFDGSMIRTDFPPSAMDFNPAAMPVR
jgi:hypothetical protein